MTLAVPPPPPGRARRRRRSPNGCDRASPATSCSRCRSTRSTLVARRRRQDDTSLAARDGEDAVDQALPRTPAQRAAWLVDRPLSTGGGRRAARGSGSICWCSTRRPSTSWTGTSATTPIRPSVAVALADGGTMPGVMTTSPACRLLDPVRPRATGAPRPTGPCAARPSCSPLRDEFGPALRRSAVLTTSDLGVPDAATAAALDRFADQSPALPRRAGLGAARRRRPADRRRPTGDRRASPRRRARPARGPRRSP